jgi:hopanoid biosynthesis associated RND transporter like protein HpnN
MPTLFFDKWISDWIGLIFRHRWWVLLAVSVVCALAAVQATSLSVDTDNYKLIRRSGQWVQDLERFQKAFPATRGLSYVIVEGPSAEETYRVSRALARDMQGRSDLFQNVFLPQQFSFLVKHSLYFQGLDALEAIASRSETLQPVLAALDTAPGLDGLADGVGSMLDADPRQAPAKFGLLRALFSQAQRVAAGGTQGMNWREWLIPAPQSAKHAQIMFQGVRDYAATEPNRAILDAIDGFVANLEPPTAARVRVTGDVALDYDEIQAALQSVQLAGTVSLAALAIILTLGVRSLRSIVATFVALAVGLLWTLAFAARFVGPFNTISIVFVVMFIGLGLDFSIHYCLRAIETFDREGRTVASLAESSTRAWRGIVLAASTTAIGFLAFVPTDYRGLAELGEISAAGMVLAVLSTYVVVPLFFAFAGLATGRAKIPRLTSTRLGTPHLGRMPDAVIRWMYRHARTIVVFALVAGSLCLLTLPLLRFDFDTLALKDPRSESMQALADLRARGVVTNYVLALVVPPGESLERIVVDLAAQPAVGSVLTPSSVVPEGQADKRELMRAARRSLRAGLTVAYRPDRLTDEARLAALERLIERIVSEAPSLGHQFKGLLQASRARQGQIAFAKAFEQSLLAGWPDQLAEVLTLLGARPFSFEELPVAVKRRLVSEQGDRLVRVLPAPGYEEGDGLRKFIEQVHAVAPSATGRPVAEHKAAELMLRSLYQALAYALIGLTLLLYLTLRRVRDVGLVMLPIVLAALFTAAAMVALDLPFNMANILVAPLIFGLGLAGSIQILERFRESGSLAQLLNSSTPWAVYLSYLTTLVTFGSLVLSTYPGMRSIGELLLIALIFAIFCVIVVFSALLHLIEGDANGA